MNKYILKTYDDTGHILSACTLTEEELRYFKKDKYHIYEIIKIKEGGEQNATNK